MSERDTPVYCDCCGTEKLGVLRDGKLIITDRRDGRWHIKTLSLQEFARLIEEALKQRA